MVNTPKVSKGIFKILTGFIVGGAIGSILGLTLAPREGKETRRAIREKSLEMFLKGKAQFKDEQKIGIIKRAIIRILTPKKNKVK